MTRPNNKVLIVFGIQSEKEGFLRPVVIVQGDHMALYRIGSRTF